MEGALIGVIVSAILSAIGYGVNAYQTKKANERQIEHDQAMAALNHRYREEEAVSSFEREATFNQFASDTQKMQEAGLSPALMYGGSVGSSAPSVSSVGSSQSAGNVGRSVNMSDFFGKLDPAEYTEQAIQRMNARTMQEKTRSDVSLQNQYELESISRTLENKRNTAFKKSLETTLFNQEQQKLNQLRIGNETGEFELGLAKDTRELEVERRRLVNKEMESSVRKIEEEIKNQPVMRQKMRTEMDTLMAQKDNYYSNSALLRETMKTSQISRVMKEFGLSARILPPKFRADDLNKSHWTPQLKAAKYVLMENGFSDFEATYAVLYYVCKDADNLTNQMISAASKLL